MSSIEEQSIHKTHDMAYKPHRHYTIINVNQSTNARLSLIDSRYDRDMVIEDVSVISEVAYELIVGRGVDMFPRFLPLIEGGKYGLHVHVENTDLKFYSIVKINGDLQC